MLHHSAWARKKSRSRPRRHRWYFRQGYWRPLPWLICCRSGSGSPMWMVQPLTTTTDAILLWNGTIEMDDTRKASHAHHYMRSGTVARVNSNPFLRHIIALILGTTATTRLSWRTAETQINVRRQTPDQRPYCGCYYSLLATCAECWIRITKSRSSAVFDAITHSWELNPSIIINQSLTPTGTCSRRVRTQIAGTPTAAVEEPKPESSHYRLNNINSNQAPFTYNSMRPKDITAESESMSLQYDSIH